MNNIGRVAFCLILFFLSLPLMAQVTQGTAFTYQGELLQSGAPVTNTSPGVVMSFSLWNDPTATAAANLIGTQTFDGSGVNPPPVQVVNGIFTVTLDFGGAAFITVGDDARWLSVTVAGNTLSPRTQIQNAPYALTSQMAYSVPAGSIGTTQINATQVQARVASAGCPSGSSIRVINQDGSVTCQTDADTGGTVISVATDATLAGGPITTSGTLGIAAGGVGTTQLASGAVTTANIASGAVGTTQLAANSVTSSKIDATVQAALQNQTTTCPAGQVLQTFTPAGVGTCVTNTPSGTTWNLQGNPGNPSGPTNANFLGTTDASPLIFKVNNVTVGQIQPSSGSIDTGPNVIFGSSVNNVGSGLIGATIGGGGYIYCLNPSCSNNYKYPNTVSGNLGTVGGGSSNTASDVSATVGGGDSNTAGGPDATVAGGYGNTASGFAATVAGGNNNTAGGDYSFAGGLYAHVRSAADIGGSNTTGDQGTFVWSDSTATAPVYSSGNNQFLVRATGGVFFQSGGTLASPSGVYVNAGSGAWSSYSDFNAKTHFRALDPAKILDAVLGLDITRWSYRTENAVEHIGPMAQDFFAAFKVGPDDRHITTVDEEGVALAAIQGLNAKLESENAELRTRLQRIETRLNATSTRP